MLLGWLLWLKAWLSGGGVSVVADGAGTVALGQVRRVVDDGWCDVDGGVETWLRYERCAFAARRAVAAYCERFGSRRVVRARWRRVFRVFTDFARDVRGDCALPRAHSHLPEGGCGPPEIWATVRVAAKLPRV